MPSSTALLAGLVVSIVTAELVALPKHKDTKKADLHHRMTKRDIAKYFGVNSHAEVPEYEVVSPFQAGEKGEFVTHVLHKRSRAKRNTADQSFLFYSMNAFGSLIHLNVTKAQPILAPGTIVETTHENGSTTYQTAPKNTFYSGHVVSMPGSIAAISNNNGLTGMINLMNHALFIHPLPSHLAQDYGSASGVQPHLIYKRSLKDVLGQGCNVDTEDDRRGLERNRIRRSSTPEGSPSHKYLEVAMIADDLVVKRHGEEHLSTYLMMLAHLVNNMFHDESAGVKKLTVVVVKLVIKKDGFGYDSSANNRQRLHLLTNWAMGKPGKSPLSDKNSTLPDILFLLTGYGFGGLAAVGSTCATQFGKTVNNDIGLASAIIIAHEAAHTFGLGHDGKGARCNDGKYIMSSAVSRGINAFKWSDCSRNLIQDFLTGSGSFCLDNNPNVSVHEPSIFHKKLPGQIVNATLQCSLQFGIEFYACPQKTADCGSLFCTKDGFRCSSYAAPPVDGTRCGDRHWCIKGECVDDGSPMIDGGWSEWQEFQPCSRSCGGGVTWRTRTCTNPVPQNGGDKCQGSSKGLWEICNTQPCPKGHMDYRLHQCRKFQHTTQVRWEADPCALSCQRGSMVIPRGRVKDGTRCSSNPKVHDVCIEGVCKPVGCDLKLNSGLKYDRCAVCGGNSSMCSYVNGSYTKHWRRWGPNNPDEIVTIPKGSTNIFALVKAKTRNLLGVKDEENNWVYRVGYTWSTVVAAAGTRVAYDHRAYLWEDKVEIPGPTQHELKIKYVFIRGGNPGVEYHFFSSNRSQVNADDVHWKTGAWELCSEDCAGGYQRRLVECVRKDDGSYVNDEMCIKTQSKPITKTPCNLQPCAAEWYESGWRPCSQTCGKGIQRRQIVCRRKISQDQYEKVNDSSCDLDKPTGILQQECNKVSCPAEWKALAWSECSRSCGGGNMTRTLRCMKRNSYGNLITVSNHHCIHAAEPITIEECNTDIDCPRAIVGSDGKDFIPLGCYKDSNNYRALPELVANFRGRLDWSKLEKTVEKCAHQVVLKNSTYKVFGLQFYGECWSGNEGEKTYSEYGWSRNCWQGVGGSNTNFVYEFVDDKKKP